MYKIRVLVEKPGIGTIKSFTVDKYVTSLLGGNQADVVFTYSNKKQILIFGDEKDVFHACIQRIKLKKNKAEAEDTVKKFIEIFKNTVVGTRALLDKRISKHLIEKYYNPFSVGKPENLLNEALMKREMSVKQLAEKMKEDTEQKESTTYTHTSGARAISREVALKYSEILKCDPVDLMFNKVTIPVWGKVNLMMPVDLEKTYGPGEIYTYASNVADTEITIVPRDLWRSDIKAIKVDAKGTMFHNQVAFYYYKKNNDEAALNKLCIVGREVKPNPELDPDYTETQYYFGVYENIRGKSYLINPDPFVDDMEQKYILKNFRPSFVAPVVAMVNTDSVVDDTDKAGSIPQSEWRKEESLRIEKDFLRRKLKEKDITEKETRAIKAASEKVNKEIERFEQKLAIQMREQQKIMETALFEKEKQMQEKSFFGKKYLKVVKK